MEVEVRGVGDYRIVVIAVRARGLGLRRTVAEPVRVDEKLSVRVEILYVVVGGS